MIHCNMDHFTLGIWPHDNPRIPSFAMWHGDFDPEDQNQHFTKQGEVKVFSLTLKEKSTFFLDKM